MYVIVIDFGDGQVEVLSTSVEKKAQRIYSIARIVFPSARIEVYLVSRVM